MCTVLVVDDDSDIRKELAMLLANEGYAVCQATDGEEALAILNDMSALPQLILLDLMMPKMNGYEVLAVLAGSPHLSEVPVIVVTAFGGSASLAHARRVVAKPFDVERLLGFVEEYCAA